MVEKVILKRIAHAYYSHTDIDKTKTFLKDFGLTEVAQDGNKHYFRGYGDLPYIYVAEDAKGEKGVFKGVAFEAESEEDLLRASRLPNASAIQEVNAPGGGRRVTIPDPDGIAFHVIYGQQIVSPSIPKDATREMNVGIPDVNQKARPAGKFQRFDTDAIVPVHKLGHFVINVPDYTKSAAFYLMYFNFTPSDVMRYEKDGPIVAAFLHLDRGLEQVDHHSMYLQTNPPGWAGPSIHHCAFEVLDMDSEFRAHSNLLQKNYTLGWGVGRHILGSQIFDYWHQIEDGFNIEHYADGDLVNSSTPVGQHVIDAGRPVEEHLSVWGPKFGPEFFTVASPLLMLPTAA